MTSSLVALMLLSLFLGCGCWLIFLWAVKKGEFTDIERPKHRMLEDDDDTVQCLNAKTPSSKGAKKTEIP